MSNDLTSTALLCFCIFYPLTCVCLFHLVLLYSRVVVFKVLYK